MAIPDFVVELRKKIGHDLLWMPGVTAVVLRVGDDDEPQVLLVRRADNGAWTPVTGIIDPGEQPAEAAAREVVEETGVHARAELLVRVQTQPPTTHVNGDQAQYLDLTFRMAYVSGQAHPADGENSEVEWFALDDLPTMSAEMHARIDAALAGQHAARFTL